MTLISPKVCLGPSPAVALVSSKPVLLPSKGTHCLHFKWLQNTLQHPDNKDVILSLCCWIKTEKKLYISEALPPAENHSCLTKLDLSPVLPWLLTAARALNMCSQHVP